MHDFVATINLTCHYAKFCRKSLAGIVQVGLTNEYDSNAMSIASVYSESFIRTGEGINTLSSLLFLVFFFFSPGLLPLKFSIVVIISPIATTPESLRSSKRLHTLWNQSWPVSPSWHDLDSRLGLSFDTGSVFCPAAISNRYCQRHWYS